MRGHNCILTGIIQLRLITLHTDLNNRIEVCALHTEKFWHLLAFYLNLTLVVVGLSSKPWCFMRKSSCCLSEHSCYQKSIWIKKIQCRCCTAIYINFPPAAPKYFMHTGWRWRYSLGSRSRFCWKLHPSSQAWLLLSISIRGETAIAKCGNCAWVDIGYHENSELNQYDLVSRRYM